MHRVNTPILVVLGAFPLPRFVAVAIQAPGHELSSNSPCRSLPGSGLPRGIVSTGRSMVGSRKGEGGVSRLASPALGWGGVIHVHLEGFREKNVGHDVGSKRLRYAPTTRRPAKP